MSDDHDRHDPDPKIREQIEARRERLATLKRLHAARTGKDTGLEPQEIDESLGEVEKGLPAPPAPPASLTPMEQKFVADVAAHAPPGSVVTYDNVATWTGKKRDGIAWYITTLRKKGAWLWVSEGRGAKKAAPRETIAPAPKPIAPARIEPETPVHSPRLARHAPEAPEPPETPPEIDPSTCTDSHDTLPGPDLDVVAVAEQQYAQGLATPLEEVAEDVKTPGPVCLLSPLEQELEVLNHFARLDPRSRRRVLSFLRDAVL